MLPKKKKFPHAHDAIVQAVHIHTAQQTMFQKGAGEILKQVNTIEPELTAFITAAAKEIAAGAMIDCDMPRPVAQHLRERIAALALNIYGAYNLAIYDHYKDLFKGTAVAALDAEPEPAPPSPQAPPSGETGGACVS